VRRLSQAPRNAKIPAKSEIVVKNTTKKARNGKFPANFLKKFWVLGQNLKIFQKILGTGSKSKNFSGAFWSLFNSSSTGIAT